MREANIALLFLIGGCAQQRIPEMRTVAGRGSESEINQVIEGALLADGRSQPADSLYSPHGLVIAQGKVRRGPPRYAGIGAGGEVAITNTHMEIRPTAAWGNVEYRWVSDRTNVAQVGRASFVLTPAQGRPGWWIVQAHSSMAK
jgi:hypothetical protein